MLLVKIQNKTKYFSICRFWPFGFIFFIPTVCYYFFFLFYCCHFYYCSRGTMFLWPTIVFFSAVKLSLLLESADYKINIIPQIKKRKKQNTYKCRYRLIAIAMKNVTNFVFFTHTRRHIYFSLPSTVLIIKFLWRVLTWRQLAYVNGTYILNIIILQQFNSAIFNILYIYHNGIRTISIISSALDHSVTFHCFNYQIPVTCIDVKTIYIDYNV
jgi:hypothetical protein